MKKYFLIFCMMISTLLAEGKTDMSSMTAKAKGGDAQLQYELGLHYMFEKEFDANGREAAPDYAHAFLWISKAAQNGHTEAQRLLSTMYARGRGTPKNPDKAEYWLRKSQEH